MFLVTGIPASGKSTVAAALARRFDRGVHVSGDALRDMVVAGRVDVVPDASEEARRQLVLRYRQSAWLADSFADAGYTVVVEDNVLGAILTDFVAWIRSRPLLVVALAPTADVVAARDAARPKTGYRSWSIEALDGAFRSETPRIGLWLDTSAQTPEQTVDEILARASTEASMEPGGPVVS